RRRPVGGSDPRVDGALAAAALELRRPARHPFGPSRRRPAGRGGAGGCGGGVMAVATARRPTPAAALPAGPAAPERARGRGRHVLTALALTAGFGLAMANGLWFVDDRAGFAASTHAYATLFLTLNVYNLVNIFVGIAVLFVAALRAGAGHLDRRDHDLLTVAV